MWVDPIVEEVRQARPEYAARFKFDLEAMFHDLREQERKSGPTYVSYPPRRLETPEATPTRHVDLGAAQPVARAQRLERGGCR
jgi:hypothetical protein